MKGNVAFTMKDVVLLAVSFYLLKQDVLRASRSAVERRESREVGEPRATAALSRPRTSAGPEQITASRRPSQTGL
jgi:hypothetical protein